MRSPLIEIGRLFLKIGTIGFGGPAAFYAMMEDETVQRRGWLTRQQFIDLLGASNLIPGPNATEMAMHIGYVRGGAMGLIVGGFGFLLPAVLVTTAFAWLYVEYGQQPQIGPVIAGIKPAVLAIIFSAGWRLGKKAINGWIVGFVAAAVGVASMCDVREVPALLCASLLGAAWLLLTRRTNGGKGKPTGRMLAAAAAGGAATGATRTACAAPLAPLAAASAATGTAVSLLKIGLFFLKVGAVLYGTGYVLVAYLQGDLVDQYRWLTEDQLMEAVAIGQFTPGPIVCTATFIGYILMAGDGNHHMLGLAGAAVATAGIFLPSFVLVAITNPIIPKLRKNRWTAAFLDAVNAATMGLMAAVTIKLAWRIFFPISKDGLWTTNWQALVIAVLASGVLLRWQVGAVWLVLGGAAAGTLFWLVGW